MTTLAVVGDVHARFDRLERAFGLLAFVGDLAEAILKFDRAPGLPGEVQ